MKSSSRLNLVFAVAILVPHLVLMTTNVAQAAILVYSYSGFVDEIKGNHLTDPIDSFGFNLGDILTGTVRVDMNAPDSKSSELDKASYAGFSSYFSITPFGGTFVPLETFSMVKVSEIVSLARRLLTVRVEPLTSKMTHPNCSSTAGRNITGWAPPKVEPTEFPPWPATI